MVSTITQTLTREQAQRIEAWRMVDALGRPSRLPPMPPESVEAIRRRADLFLTRKDFDLRMVLGLTVASIREQFLRAAVVGIVNSPKDLESVRFPIRLTIPVWRLAGLRALGAVVWTFPDEMIHAGLFLKPGDWVPEQAGPGMGVFRGLAVRRAYREWAAEPAAQEMLFWLQERIGAPDARLERDLGRCVMAVRRYGRQQRRTPSVETKEDLRESLARLGMRELLHRGALQYVLGVGVSVCPDMRRLRSEDSLSQSVRTIPASLCHSNGPGRLVLREYGNNRPEPSKRWPGSTGAQAASAAVADATAAASALDAGEALGILRSLLADKAAGARSKERRALCENFIELQTGELTRADLRSGKGCDLGNLSRERTRLIRELWGHPRLGAFLRDLGCQPPSQVG